MTIVAEWKNLRVYESVCGYYVEYIPTGEEKWMSDGVDIYTDGTEEDRSIPPGTSAWNQACQRDLESTYPDWVEAYFGLLIDKGDA